MFNLACCHLSLLLHSLVATNAARFRLLAGPDMKLMEIGLRRAQGPDGALSASKYSYIGGFDCTSNILAGKLYGIPVRGTIAHSFIMSFTSLEEVRPRELPPLAGGEPVDLPSLTEQWLRRVCELLGTPQEKANQGELAAFVSYAVTFPQDFQGLLDTYCVRRSGLPNFCAVALALHQLGYRAIGVRLDSGDLAQQSKEIRQVLRACGAHFQVPWFETIPIAVSNDISEQSLEEFSRELVEVNGSPCLKLTEDEEKMTIPGSKTIYRLYDAAGHPFMDLMALEEEPSPSAGQEVAVHVLGQLGETSKVVPTTVEPLHRTYFRDGQVCEPLPSLMEVRNHAQVSLSLLSPAHRRLREPQPYPVRLPLAVTISTHLATLLGPGGPEQSHHGAAATLGAHTHCPLLLLLPGGSDREAAPPSHQTAAGQPVRRSPLVPCGVHTGDSPCQGPALSLSSFEDQVTNWELMVLMLLLLLRGADPRTLQELEVLPGVSVAKLGSEGMGQVELGCKGLHIFWR
uniref:Nicotinate phosphoribosyltransferase n=1 Tax=Calidris pygmaea TaxID=425635 RepID=A0A8C3PHB7_9CHAR